MDKSLLTICIVVLLSISAIAQQFPPDYFKSTPPTPNVASLGKFTEVPVSLYTGVPNITIPIYEIQLKGLSFPIAVNYHSSGVRVDEIASNVGLGWALEAGGAIYSTAIGKPDFSDRGFLNTREFPQDRLLQPSYDPSTGFNEDYEYCMYVTGARRAGDPSYINYPDFDTKPDIFFYNFLGRSGKFVFSRDRIAHTIPYKALQIDHLYDNNYKIKDEDGNIFTFDKKELVTTNIRSYQTPDDHNTDYNPVSHTYYLTKIQTRYGEQIDISYSPTSYSYDNFLSLTRYNVIPGLDICSEIKNQPRYESTTEVEGFVISKITSTLGHQIDFIYSECARLDLPGSTPLKKIIITESGKEREFVLNYGYFNYRDANECSPGGVNPEVDQNKYRLKLNSIKESGKPPYEITYIDENDLPSRNSMTQDHWGFYNGLGSLTMLPKQPEYGFLSGADKTPNFDYMKKGIIDRLAYPTGGYTTFEFEPHDYFVNGSETKLVSHLHALYSSDYPYDPSSGSSPLVKTLKFPMPSVRVGALQIEFKATPKPAQASPQFNISIQNLAGTFIMPIGSVTGESPGWKTFHLSPDIYLLKIERIGDYEDGFVRLHYTEEVRYDTTYNRIIGGLRIKKIKDFASASTTAPIVREFKYKKSHESNASSGQQLYRPNYVSEQTFTKYAADDPSEVISSCDYYVQTSTSLRPLNGINGSGVGYTDVQVYYGENGSLGMSDNKFSFIDDFQPFTEIVSTPSTSYDWRRGLPEEISTYRFVKETGEFLPQKKIKSYYKHNFTPQVSTMYTLPTEPNETHVLGLNILLGRPEGIKSADVSLPSLIPAGFAIEAYKVFSVWSYLEKKEEYVYDFSDMSKFVKKTSTYEYNNPRHAHISSVKEEFSDGRILETKITYPLDYPGSSGSTMAAAVSALQSKHILGEAIEKQKILTIPGKDPVVTSSSLTYFKSESGFVRPDELFVTETSNPLNANLFQPFALDAQGVITKSPNYQFYAKMEYYDLYGNPTQLRKRDDTRVSMVWGYKNLLLAEVVNAKKTQIFYTSFEEDETATLTFSKTGRKSKYNGYTVNNNFGSGTFIISYWEKDNVHSGWEYKEQVLTGASVSIGAGKYVDEVRVYPKGAQMTTYTYDPLIGVTSMTDPNNITTYYDYDDIGRLMNIRDDNRNIIQNYQYNYANSNE